MPIDVAKDMKSGEDRESVRLRMSDGKLIANYSVYSKDEYTDYEKVFDTFDQFVEYTEEFFNQNEE